MKLITFLIGLICGGAIGALLGLVFAPSEGQQTRAELARAANAARDKVSAPWRTWEPEHTNRDVIKQSI